MAFSREIESLLWGKVDDAYGGRDWDNKVSWAFHEEGYVFGKNPVDKFCKENDIKLIVTSGLAMEGFLSYFEDRIFTIISAANLNQRCGNLGAIFTIDEEGQRQIETFEIDPVPKAQLQRGQKLDEFYPMY